MDTQRIETSGGLDYIEFSFRGGSTVEIVDIMVRSERRTGVGTWLIHKMLERVAPGSNIYAITRRRNHVAILFYESLGFSFSSILPNFYQDNSQFSDALLLTKLVTPQAPTTRAAEVESTTRI